MQNEHYSQYYLLAGCVHYELMWLVQKSYHTVERIYDNGTHEERDGVVFHCICTDPNGFKLLQCAILPRYGLPLRGWH